MTKLGGWVGEVTRTSRLYFGSDPAYHWDTIHKLFRLVEVWALPIAFLLCSVLLIVALCAIFQLSVCEQDISKGCGRIQTKFGGQAGCVTWTNWLDFGEEHNLIRELFKVILHHWETGPKRYLAQYLKTLWTDYDETWTGWVCDFDKFRFLPLGTSAEEVMSLPPSVRPSVRPSVCPSVRPLLACLRDNSSSI